MFCMNGWTSYILRLTEFLKATVVRTVPKTELEFMFRSRVLLRNSQEVFIELL